MLVLPWLSSALLRLLLVVLVGFDENVPLTFNGEDAGATAGGQG